jgi:uncharacterized repeat protein (TIGR01451 family)
MNIGMLAVSLPLVVGAPTDVGPAPHGPLPPPPVLAAAACPLLFVKVLPPAGAKTSWYLGVPSATAVKEPASIGLRPGYSYRIEITDLPDWKGARLYPSLEVRGTLQPPMGMDVSKHPVPMVITERDVEDALRGRLVTKVYFLEDPQRADSISTVPDQSLEYPAANELEALEDARLRGRPVLIFRLGERTYSPDELAAENVAGTVLMPGAATIPVPAYPPRLPYGGIPLFDPLLGPKCSELECLHDGGDSLRPLGVDNRNKLYGLDPSDTAIEYTTPKGRRVETSNRVCICVPRFAAVRSDVGPTGHASLRVPEAGVQLRIPNGIHTPVPPRLATRIEQPEAFEGSERASATIGVLGPHTLEALLGKPMAVAEVRGARVVAQVFQPADLTGYPKCEMTLIKWMEPRCPQKIGEEVTFFLRYHNGTNAPMADVVVSDSLTARLEYIPGTAKSDRPATLTVAPNEAGSVALRWAIDGKLLPGENGLITFKAKIR